MVVVKKSTVGEHVKLRRGNSYKSAQVGSEGVPLLGLGTIAKHGGFKASKLRYYPEPVADRITIRGGQLFVSLKDMTHEAALLGAVARVPKHMAIARLTQDTIALDWLPGATCTPDFLYWTLQTPRYRAYCRNRGTGTTNLDLSQQDFLAYEFPLPTLPAQRAIADVLGALDDKIAANLRVAEKADELMNVGWRNLCRKSTHVPLSSLAQFVNGRAFTKDATGTGRVVIRIAELNSGITGSTVRNDIVVDDCHIAFPGDFLMAWSGSLTTARWYREEAIVNQHIFKVIPVAENPLWAVACAVNTKMADFKAEAASKATTMGHIQRKHLDESVAWPTLPVTVAKWGQALWDRGLSAERENQTLAETRDELLPLLMSGKITVKEAEEVTEAVL